MRTIYRYPLEIDDVQTIRAPGLVRFLSVDGSRGTIELWALVDTALPEREHEVRIVGTGNPFPDEIRFGGFEHLGHAITHNGAFVWHVWANPYPTS